MCGILGIIGNDYVKIDTLLKTIDYRGPDASKAIKFANENVSVGHVRLSIIDLDERSNQPFISKCGNYYLVFNGEIYNYNKLGAELQSVGYTFSTTSDTEVLMYWLIEHGTKKVNDLDGMFAFAFYNKSERTIILCRDHFGEKPLYYSHNGNEFAFCSEIAPILQLEWIDRRLNIEALNDYLFFLYSPAPHTLYNGVKEIEPGQILSLNLQDMSIDSHHYFELVKRIDLEPNAKSLREDIATFNNSFTESIESRMIADVPVGMFLSGGLDSNAIVAKSKSLMDVKFHSFTMSYSTDTEASEHDESAVAKKCAEFYGIENTVVKLGKANDFEKSLDRTIKMFSQPFGNATCLVSDLLSAEVVKNRKVCLVGDGGDELLIGYPRYKALRIYRYFSYLPSPIKNILNKVVRLLPESGPGATRIRRVRQFLEFCDLPIAEAYINWVGYCPMHKLASAMKRSGNTKFYDKLISIFNHYSKDSIRAASIVDFVSFVPYNLLQSADRTSMRHSLELRSPFVAKKLVLDLLNMQSKHKISLKYNKPLLVNALKDILPGFILTNTKKPFNPPMRTFLRNNIHTVRELLCTEKSLLPSLLDMSFIKREINDFESGKRDNSTYIWGLSVLEKWLRYTYPAGIEVA